MYGVLRPILFRLDPERAHDLALSALEAAQRRSALLRSLAAPPPSPRLAMEAFGLSFPAPLGIAAGFDKGARVPHALLALGFSHVEVGTVTPVAQPGNDRPRMQRVPRLSALVNRLGFPNPGAVEVADRLASRRPAGIVGANLGPNKQTPPDRVAQDLAAATAELAPHAAYLAVNVSSPNTPGLRALQTPDAVARLVGRVLEAADDIGHPRPVLLKLHPDAPDGELVQVAQSAVDAGAKGVIATNTTRARPPGTEGCIEGGLSGPPLLERSRGAIRALHQALGRDTPVIGVGGIASAADALGHVQAGATLVQAYTGFVYGGPRFPRRVHEGMVAAMDRLGVDRLAELVP